MRRALAFLCILCVLPLQACAPAAATERNRVAYLQVAEPVFGDLMLIGWLYAYERDAVDLAAVKTALLDALDGIDREVSLTRTDSDLARFNRNEGGEARADGTYFPVGRHTAAIVRLALGLCAETDGAYDPTLAPLSALWSVTAADFADGHAGFSPPTAQALADAKAACGTDGIAVVGTEDAPLLKKTDPRKTLDLGGIAKGYACDVLRGLLAETDVSGAAFSLSGNILLYGAMPDAVAYNGVYYAASDRPFTAAIADPWDDARASLVSFVCEGETTAVVTSGDYERVFTHDDLRICHVLDGATGLPVGVTADGTGGYRNTDADILTSATVFGTDGARADALATALLVLGMQKGLTFAAEHGVEALLIGRDGTYACLTSRPARTGSGYAWKKRALTAKDGFEVHA